VSFNGSYNTTPTWSPAKGASVIAYTTRDGGHYDIDYSKPTEPPLSKEDRQWAAEVVDRQSEV